MKISLKYSSKFLAFSFFIFIFFGIGNVLFGQATNDYRSVATGNWNVIATWQRYNGTAWVAATATPTSTAGVITIRSGNIVTVSANVSIDQTIVDAGGQITVNASRTLTIANGTGTDMTVNGTLVNSGAITTTGTLVFNSGSTYQHARNGGSVPIATWDAASTCNITGVTNSTLPININTQSFGNFIWNCTSQSTGIVNLEPNGMLVQGNFSILSTGTTGSLRLLNTATSRNLTVGKNFLISGGTFNMSGNTGVGTMNVGGNFTISGGTITETSTGRGEIVFNGTATQVFTSGGTIANTINFTVNSGSILNMAAATTVVSGAGSFTLSGGATLGITSPAGITSSGTSGNIQVTGTRSFSTTANYTYLNTAAQVTGNGLPSTVNNLTANSGGLTQSAGSTSQLVNLLTDSFNNLTDWTGDVGTGNNQITTVASANAGGTANEARYLYGANSGTYYTSNIYRTINTTGFTGLNIQWKQLIDNYDADTYPYTIKVQCATSTGGPWTDIYSLSPTGTANIGPETKLFSGWTTNVGGSFVIRFLIEGYTWGIDYWYFDDLIIDGFTNASTLTVNGIFAVNNGTYQIGSNNLILNGSLTGSYAIIGGSASNLTIGGTGANLSLPQITNGLNIFTLSRPNGATLTTQASTANLVFTSGKLTTTVANLLTITSNLTNAISGYSSSNYINGPLARTIAPGSVNETYVFPIGAGSYNPVELVNINTTSGGNVVISAKVTDASTGGSPGTGMLTINTNRYWQTSILSGGENLTNYQLKLTETAALPGNAAVGFSTTLNGSYDRVSTGTPAGNTITSDVLINQGYFVIGTAISLFVNPSSLAFGFVASGSTSSNLTYVLSGQGLTGYPGTIVVGAPANFQVSLSSGSGFSSSINVPFTGPTLASTTIYVRFQPTSPDVNYSGDITHFIGGENQVLVSVSGNSFVYCAAGSTTCDEYVENVRIGSIDNTTTCSSGGYADYTSLYTNTEIGVGYPISVTNGLAYQGDQCGIWVDWNQDGDFDDTDETIAVSGGEIVFTATIIPPTGAMLGSSRMRIRITYTGTLSPCGVVQYGEVEDYTLNVIEPQTISTGTIAPTTLCSGTSVDVPYTIVGIFSSGNIFTAQLSDASGSFASPIDIGVLVSINSGTISGTIPLGSPTGTAYRIRVVSSSPVVTGTDNGVDLSISSSLQWTGDINENWNNAGNWACFSIPDLTTDVQIPNVPNQPILSSGTVGSVKNIVIDNGASFTVAGNTIQIAGTITNNGTFTATSGTVEMIGASAQSISTDNFTGNTIQNLKISNPSGVTLLGNLSITGIVTANSTLNSDGYLTLVSTATQTALIDGSGSGQVLGNVTMQRYLPDAFGYKYISSPFQAALVDELSDDIDLSATFPTFYEYVEDRISAGWVNYTATSNILYPLEGYAGNFGGVSQPGIFDMNGIVNNGAIQLTLYNHNQPYTQGFNLVGNPYPSPIDWDAASGWTMTNIDDAVYYFDASTTDQYTGTYNSYINGVSSDGTANNIIPSMQGFFVHVTDGAYPVTGTLGTTNAVRVNDLSPSYHKSTDAMNLAIMRFAAAYDESEAVSDVLAIYFDDLATPTFDNKKDALKLANTDASVPNLYSFSTDDFKLSVNAIPFPGEEIKKIPLGIKIEKSGNISFKATDLKQMPVGLKVYFSDAATGINQELELNSEYTVFLEANQYDTRFSIQFSYNTIENNPNPGSNFSAYSSNGKVYVRIYNLPENSGKLRLSNLLGQTIWQEIVNETGTYEFEPPAEAGVYLISLMSGSQIESKKIFIQN
ncbi:MAG TPA: GEVED domain-containing protein [Bacteroidales bacterium]